MKKYPVILSLVLASALIAQTSSTVIGYSVDPATQDYLLDSKTDSEFDAMGKITRVLKSSYESSEWIEKTKQDFEYSEDGLQIKNILTEWNGAEWVKKTADTLEYNEEGLVKTHISKIWNGVDWLNERRVITEYTEERISYREQHTWDQTAGWMNSIREELTYSENGLESVTSLFVWDGAAWNKSSTTTSTFDENGFLLEELIEANMGGVWSAFQKMARTYTNTNKVDTFEEFFWTADEWVPSMRSFNFFDAEDRTILTLFESYTNSEPEWVPLWKDEFTYQDNNSAVEHISGHVDGFKLANNYPNPFNPSSQISFTLPVASFVTLTVFNTVGETVAVLANGYFAPGRHIKTFLAKELAGGQYFYKLETQNFVDVKRMTLVK